MFLTISKKAELLSGLGQLGSYITGLVQEGPFTNNLVDDQLILAALWLGSLDISNGSFEMSHVSSIVYLGLETMWNKDCWQVKKMPWYYLLKWAHPLERTLDQITCFWPPNLFRGLRSIYFDIFVLQQEWHFFWNQRVYVSQLHQKNTVGHNIWLPIKLFWGHQSIAIIIFSVWSKHQFLGLI